MPANMGFRTPTTPTYAAAGGGGATADSSWMQRLLMGLTDTQDKAAQQQALSAMAAQLLAASGRSEQPISFGQALGGSMMAGQQAAQNAQSNSLKQELMKKQIEQLSTPKVQAPKRYVVNGVLVDEAGKKIFENPKQEDPKLTEAETLYAGAERLRAAGVTNDDPRMQAITRQIGRLGTPNPGVQVNMGEKFPTPPQGQWYVEDPTSPRGYRLADIPGAKPPQPTEGERNATNYLGRMQAAEKKLGSYAPNTKDFAAAEIIMSGGPITASLANMGISEEGGLYFQAAADWVRAKLRKESGATIPPDEMAQEIKTYFPMPGDSAARREQKRQARLQAEAGMRQMGGNAAKQWSMNDMTIVDPRTQTGDQDPLGILQ